MNVAKRHERTIIVSTDIGLKVRYDGAYNVYVTVDGRYKGQTRGLCGTYNGNPNDDFWKRNNQVTKKPYDFSISWKIGKKCCDSGPVTNPCKNAGAVA